MKQSLENLEKILSHTFSDKELIKTALTHSSVGGPTNYERLEFLGDRVLGLVIAELLYVRFPEEQEGDLAKRLAALVQGSFLALISREINLGAFIDFSDAEAQSGGSENDNILADVFESVIGALYLEAGFAKCAGLIAKLWDGKLELMITPPQHPKTQLQEWAQSQGLPLPAYDIKSQSGPDHAPMFEIQVTVKGYEPLSAEGKSRQLAEKMAAKLFWQRLQKESKA